MRYTQNLMDKEKPDKKTPPAGVMPADIWNRLERFLILGSEAGTYYVQPRPLTTRNAPAVLECLKTDGLRVVRTLIESSTRRRAPRTEPALFVLALAASPAFADANTISAALAALPVVAPSGAGLCSFGALVEDLRGWGRSLRTAVADWYLAKPASELANQMLDHPPRGSWQHRDLLRMSHPKAATPAHNALFQWAVDGELGHLATPRILADDLRLIQAFELVKKSAGEDEIVRLIEDHRLTDRMIPSQWKNSARVWEALLPTMPYPTLVRRLGKLTEVGLLQPQSPATALVVARLIDRQRIANSRIHPIVLWAALAEYREERAPVSSISDALEAAFHLAFENVEPTGKRIYLWLDASPGMRNSYCTGLPYLSAAMAAEALGMIFAKREPNCIAGSETLPLHDAQNRNLAVDAFVIVTDNQTWTGAEHPAQALQHYRQSSGIAAKLVVIALAANRYSSADPNDAFQMDVAGFDASVPEIVTEFVKGNSFHRQSFTASGQSNAHTPQVNYP